MPADLRAEVGLPVVFGPGALQSPLPAASHLLRKQLHLPVPQAQALAARAGGPVRPLPLSLKALRPQASSFFGGSSSSSHAAASASPRQRLPSKLRLPSLDLGSGGSAASEPIVVTPSHSSSTFDSHGTLDEQFEIERKLRAAIYGCVLKAHRRSDGKAVAIKVLSKEHIRRRTSMKDIPVYENAQVELSVLQKSAECPHPHVLRSIAAEGSQADVLHDAHHVYSITPFCDKGELFDAIRATSGLPTAQAQSMFVQVVRGVHHLHTRLGFVHNDISPENILLRSMRRVAADGRSSTEAMDVVPVLTDFGLSAKIGQPAPRVPGKVSYQAPEVLYSAGGDARLLADAASDVFSLGVLFFVMLTGVLPYDCPHRSDAKFAALQEGADVFGAAVADWDVPRCTDLVATHPELLRLVCAMTRANPSERPSLEEVLAMLESPTAAAPSSKVLSSTAPTLHAVDSVPAAAVASALPLSGLVRRQQRRSTGQSLALDFSAAEVAAVLTAHDVRAEDDAALPSARGSLSADSDRDSSDFENDDDDHNDDNDCSSDDGDIRAGNERTDWRKGTPRQAAGGGGGGGGDDDDHDDRDGEDGDEEDVVRDDALDGAGTECRQLQQSHRRRSTFLASPSPTLGGGGGFGSGFGSGFALGSNSPSGVADLAFLSRPHWMPPSPKALGASYEAGEWADAPTDPVGGGGGGGGSGSDGSTVHCAEAAALSASARALLDSSCSHSSSGSNNRKQHHEHEHEHEEQEQGRRPRRRHRQQASALPLSPQPSPAKRRPNNKATPVSTPRAGLLQHVLHKAVQLDKLDMFRASED
jgi:serine/threonine protein kinase